MQWIVDSGGTKSSWVNTKGEVKNFSGVNPNIHSKEFIISVLNEVVGVLKLQSSDSIVWYGAGCSNAKSTLKLYECFKEMGLSQVEIHHDLLAACRAVLGGDEGIVGILGTGSNACYYDGQGILEEKISLGYVMGDEGGGAYFGKRLLQDFVNGQMPEEEAKLFSEEFTADKAALVTSFYSSAAPSAHLGQFAKLLNQLGENSRYKQSLLQSGFESYMALFIDPLKQNTEKKIGFVGTVAAIYQEQLKAMCQERELEFIGVCQNPIEALLQWHNNES